MKQITLLLIGHLILMGISGIAYSNGSTTEVVVYGNPSLYPRDAADNTIPGTARIINRPTYCYVIFSLEDVSTMPGISVNYPVPKNYKKNNSDEDDLELRKLDNVEIVDGKDRWKDLGGGRLKYTLKPDYPPIQRITEVTVKIYCHDYGGYANLKAEVYGKNADGIYALVDSDTGSVPRDENNNHIPDGYCNDYLPAEGYIYVAGREDFLEVDHAAMSLLDELEDYYYKVPDGMDRQETVDADTGPPVNGENGDSLTNFEEYQGGFLKANGHKRFDPRTKDVFYVCHDGGDTLQIDNVAYVRKSMHPYGYGNVTHPNITFHKMLKEYLYTPFRLGNYDTNGWINTTSGDTPDVEKTYAIRIIDQGKSGTTLGACPRSRPYYTSLVSVYYTISKSLYCISSLYEM